MSLMIGVDVRKQGSWFGPSWSGDRNMMVQDKSFIPQSVEQDFLN